MRFSLLCSCAKIGQKKLEDDITNTGETPIYFLRLLQTEMQVWKTAEIVNSKILITMFMQAIMHHDNATRAGIVDHDVQHPATLQELIVNLRLVRYLKACKVKQSEYVKIIGSVCLAEGLRAGTEEFNGFLGGHSHGLSKGKFWGYHAAAYNDAEKRRVFLSKSNQFVHFK